MQRGRGGFSRQNQSEESAREKAIRSIFVANIAFETNEEQLKSVLAEVGPVVNLKLIYDPSGRPRGFGFCEYQDAETAKSAVRNLAGKEVNGRPLRIDSATNAPGENFRASAAPGRDAPIEPPLYGPPVPPESAPEAITKAVASLPPEQMFELMKQMKWCIEHNPEETRQLLLHNPQLAYALLQAQVVMRIVDLEDAQNMLHRPSLLSGQGPPPVGDPTSGPGGRGPLRGRDLSPDYVSPREQFGGGPMPPIEREHYPEDVPPPMRGHHPGRQGHYGRGDMHSMRPPGSRPHHPHSPIGPNMSPQDHEKAQLIMQVLSLTDEQIQRLPPDQRNSILKLKDQIAHTGGPR